MKQPESTRCGVCTMYKGCTFFIWKMNIGRAFVSPNEREKDSAYVHGNTNVLALHFSPTNLVPIIFHIHKECK